MRLHRSLKTFGAAALAVVLASLAAGCDVEETPPATQIDRLRVLSIRIDGPVDPASATGRRFAELAPGEAATLTPLVLAPGIAPLDDMAASQDVCLDDYRAPRWDRQGATCASGAAKAPVHRFWAWCPPTAATLQDDPCTRVDVLASPARIFQTEGIEPLGASCPPPPAGALPAPTPTVCVEARADLFSNPPADELTMRRGVLASVLLVTVIDVDGDVAAGRLPELLEKVQDGSVPAVVALKRVPILAHPTNHNPDPSSILAASGEIAYGASIGRVGGLRVGFASNPPQESFVQVNLDGTEEQQTEKLDIAWLSGFGRFDDAHTLSTETTVFTPAEGTGIDLPPPGPQGPYSMPFAAVARDGRGGEEWLLRMVTVPRP